MTTPRVGAIVLAAGASRRYGRENKLLAIVDGAALVTHPLDAVLEAGAEPVVVVTGYDHERVASAIAGRAVRLVHNDLHEEGMGRSLAAGAQHWLRHQPPVDGVLVVLGDLPHLRAQHVRALIDAFAATDARAPICVPVFEGRRGHPVLFHFDHLATLARLAGDRGARSVLASQPESVVEVASPDDAPLRDLDVQDTRGGDPPL